MEYPQPTDQRTKPSKYSGQASVKVFSGIYHRAYLFPIVAIGSASFTHFIDLMRSLSVIKLNEANASAATGNLAEHLWVCVSCWELILGQDTKQEHVNARHLVTSSIADSAPCSTESYLKLCRIYGRINPEETQVVLLYVPLYVKEGIRSGTVELQHVKAARKRREQEIVIGLKGIAAELDKMRTARELRRLKWMHEDAGMTIQREKDRIDRLMKGDMGVVAEVVHEVEGVENFSKLRDAYGKKREVPEQLVEVKLPPQSPQIGYGQSPQIKCPQSPQIKYPQSPQVQYPASPQVGYGMRGLKEESEVIDISDL